MVDTLDFKDKALSEAVQKSAFKFQNFQKLLDDTSADIRGLEKWLQSCGIVVYHRVWVKMDVEAISWFKAGTQWRLMYEVPADEPGYEDDLKRRPLIDTPAKVRMACRSYLPVLVAQIAELLPDEEQAALAGVTIDDVFAGFEESAETEAPQEEPAEDEIPF